MTDQQFSAQLRQHLLGTADERVVQGQLASILDQVAVIPQRRAFAARLPWFQGGVGGASTSQLRWALLIALALIGLVIAGVIAVGAPRPRITADGEVLAPTLDPGPSVKPPTAGCLPFFTEFDEPTTYTAETHSLSIKAPVPATPAEPWLGLRDRFGLMVGACADQAISVAIEAGEVTEVDTRACAVSAGAVNTFEEAVAAVSTAKGIDVLLQSDVTLGGYSGTLFDLRVHDDLNACPNGQLLLVDGVPSLPPGAAIELYLVDVDGTTLGVALYGYEGWSSDLRAKMDGILASMQIDTIRPEESIAPSQPPFTSGGIRNCLPADTLLEAPGTYTARAGSLSLTVDVSGTRDDPWIGLRSTFSLRSLRLACTDFGRSGGWIEASEATQIEATACHGAPTPVDTVTNAKAAVASAMGVNVDGQTDVTLGGHRGTRLDLRLDIDGNACAEQQIPLLNGMTPFEPGARYPLYLIDVDGKTLAIALYQTDIWRPEVSAQVDDILASLQIEP